MSDALHSPVLTEVREAHRLDESALGAYLAGEIPGFSKDMKIRQFEGGQSNPTYRIESGGRAYVLRKKPPGELLKSAHQVDREYRVMTALAETGVPVPRTMLLCDDDDVIGSMFFVMECVEGRVVTDSRMPGFTPAERTAVSHHAMEVLAAIHTVDYEAVGLGDFGRPGNYYARQISRWSKQYELSKTDDLESMDKLMEWLPKNIPESDETCLVHGDYRIGNCILHPTEPRLVAVLDWEISTLGHPLADLAYYCLAYHGGVSGADDLSATDLAESGIPEESEMVARYCELAGRPPVENWSFYVQFQRFRSAAIVQGVYKRGLDGNASSQAALEYGARVASHADAAWAMVDG